MPRTVADILDRQEYLGHTINFKTRKKSYKLKKTIKNDPSEWQIFKNTHEAIIDEDTFQTVKRIRDGRRRPTPEKCQYCPAWYSVQTVVQSYIKSEAKTGVMTKNIWSVPTIANEVKTSAPLIKYAMWILKMSCFT